MPAPTPPAGFTNVPYTSTWGSNGYSMVEYFTSPAPVVGSDVFQLVNVSTPNNWAVTGNADGTWDIASGDSQTRQAIQFYLWRALSNTVEGPVTFYDNEIAPVWASVVTLTTAVAMTAIPVYNLASTNYASSPCGDTLVFTVPTPPVSPGSAITGLPPGVKVSSAGILSGIPTSPGTYGFYVIATDSTGTGTQSAAMTIVVYPASSGPPYTGSGTNMWSADGNFAWSADGYPGFTADGYEPTPLSYAVTDLALVGVNVGVLTYQNSLVGTPPGWVITGYPYLAESTPAGQSVPLVISGGAPTTGTTVMPPNVVGKYYYEAQLQILGHGLRIQFPTFVLDPVITPGRVISQSLPVGVPVPQETLMTIVVSGFPVVNQPGVTVPVP
jgi:hypothetical protein